MKVLSTLAGLILALGLLLAILAGGYYLFRYSMDTFNMLEPQLATIIAIISLVIIIGCWIIARGLKMAKQQGISTNIFEIKETLYRQLLNQWITRIQQQKINVSPDENGFCELEQLLALYSDPKVISVHMELWRLTKQKDQDEQEISMKLVKLVTEMRSDLGSSSMIFKETELAELLLRRD